MYPCSVKLKAFSLKSHECAEQGRHQLACQTEQGKAHRLQLYMKNWRNLRNAESGRGGLPSGKHQAIFPCHMVSPEKIHTNNTMWTEHIFCYSFLRDRNLNSWSRRVNNSEGLQQVPETDKISSVSPFHSKQYKLHKKKKKD